MSLLDLTWNALWIIGVSTLFTWDHSIFRLMKDRVDFPTWTKPFFSCWPCMSSVHGIPVALYLYGLTPQAIIHVMCLHGVLAVANNLIIND
jgi:hypothetical protein